MLGLTCDFFKSFSCVFNGAIGAKIRIITFDKLQNGKNYQPDDKTDDTLNSSKKLWIQVVKVVHVFLLYDISCRSEHLSDQYNNDSFNTDGATFRL